MKEKLLNKNINKYILAALMVTGCCYRLHAQSPGGVSATHLKYWLKANAGTNPSGASGTLVSWTDQKAGVTVTTDNTNSGNPALVNGSVSAQGAYNYNPYVSFSSISDMVNLSIPANFITGSKGSIFTAMQRLNTDDIAWAYRNSSGKWAVYTRSIAVDGDNTYIASAANFATGITQITGVTVNGSAHAAYFNGLYNTSPSSALNIGDNLSGNQMAVGSGNNSNSFTGSLGEVIVYDTVLTQTESQKIVSYLGIKYGRHLGSNENGTGTFDYMASNGTIVWNGTSSNVAYHYDVAGIGRDDQSALMQLQSRSTYSLQAVSDDILMIKATSIDSNQSFLMWGNNNATGTGTFTPGPCATLLAPGADLRLNRVWKIQETGVVGAVKVMPDLTGTLVSNIYMLVSTDPTFNTIDVIVPMPVSAGQATANFDFTSGQYITFVGSTGSGGCTTCTGGSGIIKNAAIWTSAGSAAKTSNQVLNAPVTGTISSGAMTANLVWTFPAGTEYLPNASPRAYGKWLQARRRDNTTGAVTYKMSLSQGAAKVAFIISGINKHFGNPDKIVVTGTCGGNTVNGKLSYVNTKYPARNNYTISGNTATGSKAGFNWPNNNSSVYVKFDVPVTDVTITWTVVRNNTYKTLSSIYVSDAQITCANPVVPSPDNVYVNQSFITDSIPTCDTATMKITLNNANCTDKVINLTDSLPAGFSYIPDSYSYGDLPASSIQPVINGRAFSFSNLTLPAGGYDVYVKLYSTTGATHADSVQASYSVVGSSYGPYKSDDLSGTAGLQATEFYFYSSIPPQVPAVSITADRHCVSYNDSMAVNYTVYFTNNSGSPVAGLDLDFVLGEFQTMVQGTVSNSYGGKVNDGTGTYDGDPFLSIADMTIPAGNSSLTFQVTTTATDSITNYATRVSAGSECAEAACATSNTSMLYTTPLGIVNLPLANTAVPYGSECNNQSGYKYYYDENVNYSKKLFAINWNGNAEPGGLAGSITYSSSPYTNTSGSYQCNIMGRLLTITPAGGNFNVNGGVKVRIYYSQSELTNSLVPSPLSQKWFKHPGNASAVIAANDGQQIAGAAYPAVTSSGTEDGVNYIEFSNIQSFSTFGYASNTGVYPLPLQLTYFNAVWQNNNNQIKTFWITNDEQNVDHFDVERSVDGDNWSYIGTVKSAGTTFENSYSFFDVKPMNCRLYYRLKIVEHSGASDYSPVRIVNREIIADDYLVYPNPAANTVIVSWNRKEMKPISIRLINVMGQTSLLNNYIDDDFVKLNIADLPSGTYKLLLQDPKGKIISKMFSKR